LHGALSDIAKNAASIAYLRRRQMRRSSARDLHFVAAS
jgi:hypothetical protein